jgi:hypothetical protein
MLLQLQSQRPRRLMQRARKSVRRVYFSDEAPRHVQIGEVAVVIGKSPRFSAHKRDVVVGSGSKLQQYASRDTRNVQEGAERRANLQLKLVAGPLVVVVEKRDPFAAVGGSGLKI